ncbi:hypothetical protein DFQ28_007807 [Apophysomyces sp. BC1034]|nr:hypothetical protein DFQ28_007807 [Apophysomyces sp. BC1034]
MKSTALLGCIADDFTGATDLANMLVRGGMRTVQMIGVPDVALDVSAQAVVIALKSRTAARNEAVAQSLAALEWLKSQGCRQFYFKYCSTFDSTQDGNIGPVIEALMRALDTPFTIACPAFPENGRTVYRGHLFVGDTLLSESGMQNHPLTPMTNANLVRVLQQQTQVKVGLLRYDAIQQGIDAVAAARRELAHGGAGMAIADAISDTDLYTLAAACADDLLLTGGSGLALGLPGNFQRAGLLPVGASAATLPFVGGLSVVLSGSCSRATNAQVEHWLTAGRPSFRIDPLALASGAPVIEDALRYAMGYLEREAVLIYATSRPEDVKVVQETLGTNESGALVEQAMATIAGRLHDSGVRCFVVAGGETSGAVVKALDVRALQIGQQIDPGVPWTASLGGEVPLALALKSGARPTEGDLSMNSVSSAVTATETKVREEIVRIGADLYARRYTVGLAGNLSARLDDGWLITPIDACLGHLDPAAIAKVSRDGRWVSGDKPSKTLSLHRAVYDHNPDVHGVVHTHSTHLVALTLAGVWRDDEVLPPITPYAVMKVGRIPLIPYHRPGAPAVAERVAQLAPHVRGVLLERLGPVVWGPSVSQAAWALEEFEETARLWLMTDPKPAPLSATQIEALTDPIMPRFAANLSMMYQEHDFLDRFAAAAHDGFTGVEFLFPYDFAAADIVARLKDHGLTQALFNAPPGQWASGERGIASLPGREEEFRRGIRLALAYAHELGNDKIHVMAGLIGAGDDHAKYRAVYLENLAFAAHEAALHGVTIVIEPINTRDMPGYFLSRQRDAHQICTEVGASNLKVQFDLYHCQIVEGDLAMKLRQLIGSVGHIQIAGVPDRREPDDGEVNYRYLLRLIDSLGYDGWIGCEYRPRGGTSEGLGWLHEWQ